MNTNVTEAGNADATRRFPYKPVLVGAMAAAAALGIFRIKLLKSDIDPATGLYNNPKPGTVFMILLAILVVACAALYFLAVYSPVERPVRNETIMAAFSATMCGMSFATVAVASLFGQLRSHEVMNALHAGQKAAPIFFVLELLLMIPSSVYFWHICITGARSKNNMSETLLPIFPALYLGVRIVRIFIDTTHQINASERSFLLLTLVMMMMFCITEARFFVANRPGDEEKEHPKRFAAYFIFALLAAVLTVCILIPYGIVSAFSLNKPDDLLYYVLYICIGLHALLRICTF